ncbi:hypothetical protein [Marinobacterium sp. BA1]|uniref:hypothetical protein n=1 Tax=Marinobacterium sp. BA1 TaxID=3138931 RepID=UPI0032E5EE52
MSHFTPVPAVAVRDIKWLAKRFSKRLHAQTAHRIKGQSLYAAFAKPLGYDTFNQLQHQAKRSGQSSFDYDTYFGLLKRELRKHLPVLLDGDLINSLLDSVYDPGVVFLKIDGTRTAPKISQLITNHSAYRGFLAEYRDTYGDLAHLQVLELAATSTSLLASSEPSAFKVTFDLSGWHNEGDPFASLAGYEPFLRLITDLKSWDIAVSVQRMDQTGRIEELEKIEPNGRKHWTHHLPISSQIDDAELEAAKGRMRKHRSALSERLRFTLSIPALDDRGVIVGDKRKDKA